MKRKVLLFGGGRIVHKHIEALNQIGNVQIKVVEKCDQKRLKLSEQYKIAVHKTLESALSDFYPDVIVILTESGKHYLDIISLYKYSKVLLVEKPVCLNVNEANLIRSELKEKIKDIYVVHQNRLNRPVQLCKRLVEEGNLGKVTNVIVNLLWCRNDSYYNQAAWRGTKALDGGVLTNQAVHHLDLVRYLFGEVKTVSAISTTALVDIEAEDSISCSLLLQNDVLVSLHATTATRPYDLEASIKVLGSSGFLEIGGTAANELVNYFEDASDLEKFSEDISSVYGNGHLRTYENLFQYLESGDNLELTAFSDAVETVKVLNAIYSAASEKRSISVDAHSGVSEIGYLR